MVRGLMRDSEPRRATKTDAALTVVDEAAVEGFAEKLLNDYAGANAFFMAGLGDRLGLFAALAANEPQSSAELAARTGLHEPRDVGCGRGRALIKLAEAYVGCRFVGIDVYEPAIRSARARAEKAGVNDLVHFEVADGVAGPPGRYDVITTFDVLHDSPDPPDCCGPSTMRSSPPGGTYASTSTAPSGRKTTPVLSARCCTDPVSPTA